MMGVCHERQNIDLFNWKTIISGIIENENDFLLQRWWIKMELGEYLHTLWWNLVVPDLHSIPVQQAPHIRMVSVMDEGRYIASKLLAHKY